MANPRNQSMDARIVRRRAFAITAPDRRRVLKERNKAEQLIKDKAVKAALQLPRTPPSRPDGG